MTAIAADKSDTYEAWAGKRNRLHLMGTFTLGSSGAVASEDVDDPAMAVTKETGDGNYSMTFPAATRGTLKLWNQVGTTIFDVVVDTFSATAGTADFLTQIADGTATNGTSGDVIAYELWLDTEK